MKYIVYLGPIAFICTWYLITILGVVDTFFLPNPWETCVELFSMVFDGSIIRDALATLSRVVISFGIATVLGVSGGLILGSKERLYRSCEFVIDFFRSTPATALFPLFLLVFGVSDASKVAVAIFASTLILVFNTAYGVIHSKKSRILAAKSMGASNIQIFKWVLIWESLPQTFVGLRSAASLSLVVIVVTEMFIGTNMGLGRKIIDAQLTYEITTMYAVILLTGIIGYTFNMFFLSVERKVLHWTKR